MPIEVTLFVSPGTSSEGVNIRLLNISGLSIEAAERLADNLDGSLRLSKHESAAVSRTAWYLLRDFSGSSWEITVRYSDGRDNGQLFYKSPGEAHVQPLKDPPEVQRVSRYVRPLVI